MICTTCEHEMDEHSEGVGCQYNTYIGAKDVYCMCMKEPRDFVVELEARLALLEQAARPFADLLLDTDKDIPYERMMKFVSKVGLLRDLAAALDEKREPLK